MVGCFSFKKIILIKKLFFISNPFISGGPTLSIHIAMILNFVGFVNMREIITSKSMYNTRAGDRYNCTSYCARIKL